MLVPIDRPIINATNIAAAATQTVSAGFVATHNNKAVLFLTGAASNCTSDGSTPIQAGIKVGQVLLILYASNPSSKYIIIQDTGNCNLEGRWYTASSGTGDWLKLMWTGSSWYEVGRGNNKNTVSGQDARGFGSGLTVSGATAFAAGLYNTANGLRSAAFGNSNYASGNASFSMGEDAKADQTYQFAHGGNLFTSDGDSQFSRFILRESITHSDANWHTIGIDDSGIGPIIPADSHWTFEVQVSGATQDIGKCFGYLVNGSIKRIGSTTTLNAMNVTVIHEDDSDFDCQAVADDTNDALFIQVKDATSGGDAVRWVATVKLTQVIYT